MYFLLLKTIYINNTLIILIKDFYKIIIIYEFKYYKPAKSRLQRSELAVPGSSPEMFEKALNSKADYVFFRS